MVKLWRTVPINYWIYDRHLVSGHTNNNYKKYILKNTNVIIYAEYAEKNENIQHMAGACLALTQNNYTHLHNQVANVFHQELAIKCQGD
jgi:hypothetical protein